MEDDTGTDTTTHQTEQGHGAPKETTNKATLPKTKDGKEDGETEQVNSSSAQIKMEVNTPINDTITFLAEHRPGGDVHFRILKEVDAQSKQDVQIICTPAETRPAREQIQTFRGVSPDKMIDATHQLNLLRPCKRKMEGDITAFKTTESRCCRADEDVYITQFAIIIGLTPKRDRQLTDMENRKNALREVRELLYQVGSLSDDPEDLN